MKEVLEGVILGCAFSAILVAMTIQAYLYDNFTLPNPLPSKSEPITDQSKLPLHQRKWVKVSTIIVLLVIEIVLLTLLLYTYHLSTISA